MPTHSILGGKVQFFKRGSVWFARASVDHQQIKKSTGTDSLSKAEEIGEDWYLGLRGKARAGLPLKEKREPSFNDIADLFEAEYEIITEGERSPAWVASHKARLRLHLRPFFGTKGISQIMAGDVQNYRVHRAGQFGRLPPKDKNGKFVKEPKPPSRSTLHDEIGTLSLVLQTAMRHGKIAGMPMISVPYKKQRKILHRPWFNKEEYKQTYKATGQAAKDAAEAYRWNYEQLHDQVLFIGNTGLRPDEAKRLQHRDVTIAMDADTGEEILEIEVRGKTGYGPCKSMPGAVEPYRRLLARAKPVKLGRKVERDRKKERGEPIEPALEYSQPKDLLFPSNHTDLFNDILKKEGLKEDREGQPRVLYSLRHTYMEAEQYFSDEIESLLRGTNRRKPSPNQSIFKYVSLDNKTSWKYLESTLNEQKLIGGTYNGLNDPFEMSPVFLDDITPRIMNKAKRELSFSERVKIGLGPDLDTTYSEEAKRKDIAQGLSAANTFIDATRSRSRIISFSDRFDSPLLWSHYAKQYYGACLQFSGGLISSRARMDAMLSYVHYSNQRPIYPLSLAQKIETKFGNSSQFGLCQLESEKMLFFTKAQDWSYENEIRVIYSTARNTHVSFDKDELLSVIVGPRMPLEDRENIRRVIRESAMPWLPIREATISTSSFSVSVNWHLNLNK